MCSRVSIPYHIPLIPTMGMNMFYLSVLVHAPALDLALVLVLYSSVSIL